LNTFSEKNQERIRALASEMRSKHHAMEWGVSPGELIGWEGFSCAECDLGEKNTIEMITRSSGNIFKKVKAALITSEKRVLVDPTLYHAQKIFAQAHELGHHIIPDHTEAFYLCSETDLNPITRMKAEFEANIFADEILLPTPLMNKIYDAYPLSMETILLLAELSDVPVLRVAIRYVESCDKQCAILMLSIDVDSEGNPGLRLKGQAWSASWEGMYKKKLIADFQFFPHNHNLSKVVTSEAVGAVFRNTIRLEEVDRIFQVHTVFNGYNVFALLF
jgi:hypothetical protein